MIKRENDFDNIVNSELKNFDITTISDDALEFCLLVINSDQFKWTISVNDKKQICFQSNVKNVCGKVWNLKEMINSLKDPSITNYSVFRSNEGGTFTITNGSFCSFCGSTICPHSECIKGILCALVILKENGVLEQELAKRTSSIGHFKFEWKCERDLRFVDEDVYQMAKILLDEECVYIEPRLYEGRTMRIHTPFYCRNFYDMTPEKLRAAIAELKEGWSTVRITRRPNWNADCLCTSGVSCGKLTCVPVVAGRLYYLLKSGQWDVVESERAIYHQNAEAVNAELKKKYDKARREFDASRIDKKIVESFDELKGNTENLDALIQAVANTDRTNLYFAIEREEGIDASDQINTVKDALLSNERITKQTKMTIGSIYTDASKLPLSELVVVSNISSFKSSTNDKYKEKTALIDALCQPKKNRYILIVGTKAELDWLSQYSPKMKYVYEHFRIRVSNLTIDQLYDIYKKNLDSAVFTKAMNNEEDTKSRFVDFVENNRSIFPFKNTDLAKYIAQYSNACGDVEFPPYAYRAQTLDEALSSVIGMDGIKKQMKELEQYISFTNKAKSRGLKVSSMNLHMIFTGNPGCGKTMMARIMARMLFDIGMIKENKLIEVERKDLIGEYIGKTAPKTAAVIEKAMGGVLFIDEAYTLTPTSERDYGGEAIATLIKAMEDKKDDFVVIFAGYKKEMFDFVESNPGIASRIGYSFDFPDYNVSELMEIFKIKMTKNGFKLSDDALQQATILAEHMVRRRNFGNGRFVDKLTQKTITNHANSCSDDNLNLITAKSIPSIELFLGENSEKKNGVALDDIIGMDTLKKQIVEFAKYVEFSKKAREAGLKLPYQTMHMVFTGNPGCGKTTIARIVAKMLYDLDILHENKLIETERKDFIGEFVGKTAPKVEELIKRAMGGVLFIDEAYTLTPRSASDYAHEAIAALIKAMEDNKDNLIVVFAGYKKEMADFIKSNPGIASRIGYTFDFPDYTAEELLEIYKLKAKKSGFDLTDGAISDVLTLMKYFHRVDNIGNGRFVDRVMQNTLTKHARIITESTDKNIKIIDSDSIPTIDEIIETLSNGSSMLKPDQIDMQSVRKTAIHEIGHAFVGYKLNNDTDIIKITINAEGAGTLGYVLHKSSKDATQSKTELLNRIKMLMGGMCCEEVFNGEFENGNTSDLEKATRIATNMVTRYGMSSLGFAQVLHPAEMATTVQREVNLILDGCYKETRKLLSDNRDTIEKLVKYILDKKEITGDEFVEKLNEIEFH